MKVKMDSSEFDGVMTAYEFAGKWREYGNPKGRLVRAEIMTADEVAQGNENRVFLYYEHEAHAFTLKEVSKFFQVERVLIGNMGKTRVLCLVAKNPKKGK